jgi:uncharacterized protein YuzE
VLAHFRLEKFNVMTRNEAILVQSRTAPVVEIDTEAGAAYVRFKRWDAKVVRTEYLKAAGTPIVTIDFDRNNEVIGVELIGVKEFGLVKLLETAQVRAPNVDVGRTRYVGAGRNQSELVAAMG